MRIWPVLIAMAAAFMLSGSSYSATAPPKLIGTSGKGNAFVITLKDATGKQVNRVKPGRYTLVVWDLSRKHTFHFKGPGFEFRTQVPFTGKQSWSPVNLKKGTYNFWCDVHKSRMNGSLRVAF